MNSPTRGRRLLKFAAWTLAVPALCVVGMAGGAVALHLLLPDAAPTAQDPVEMAQTSAPASRQPSPPASPAPAEPVDTVVLETSEAVDESTTGSITADAPPDEGGANAPGETVAATAIPTPRPAIPRADTRTLASEATREIAALETVSPRQETAAPENARPEGVRSEAPLKGRRTTVRTGAKLRNAPRGNEIGVLRAGTEVVVGRCDRWCEVSVDGRQGFVHASLVDDGTKRSAERPAKRRIDARPGARRLAEERRVAGRRDRYDGPSYERRRYDRRDEEHQAYESAYRRNENPEWLYERELPPEDPDWFIEDEGPLADDPPVLLYYEPYP